MKKIIAILLTLAVLSGCANTAPEEKTVTTADTHKETTVTTVTTTEKVTELTTAPAVTATAESTANTATEETPEKYKGDIPRLIGKKLSCTIEKEVYNDELLKQIDITPNIDVTQLSGYDSAVNYVENYATKEEKALLIPNTYMYQHNKLYYTGTEQADWTLAINYFFAAGAGLHVSSYSRYFSVKDGIVTEELQNVEYSQLVYDNMQKYDIEEEYRDCEIFSISVTSRESGEQRNYILKDIVNHYIKSDYTYCEFCGEAYGMVCFVAATENDSYIFMLDPENNTVQYFDAGIIDILDLRPENGVLICYLEKTYYALKPEIVTEEEKPIESGELKLSPIPSDNTTEVLFCEVIDNLEIKNEADFPRVITAYPMIINSPMRISK